jgi:hypothetical protein
VVNLFLMISSLSSGDGNSSFFICNYWLQPVLHQKVHHGIFTEVVLFEPILPISILDFILDCIFIVLEV